MDTRGEATTQEDAQTSAPEVTAGASASSSTTSDPSAGAWSSDVDTQAGTDDPDDGAEERDLGTPDSRGCEAESGAPTLCFEPQTIIEGHGGLVAATGDVDDDGFTDIVFVSSVDDGRERGLPQLAVIGGTGDRRLGDPLVTAWEVPTAAALLLVDADGDGALDLVVNDTAMPGLWLAPGDGTGSFAPPQPLPLPFNAVSWATGDLDGDGVDEIVSSMWSQSSELAIVSWLDLEAPSLTLRETGFSPRDVAIADLGYGEASLDIVVAGHVGEQWQVRAADGIADGPAPWTSLASTEEGLGVFRAVDVDTDGLDDVLSFSTTTFELRPRTGPAELAAPLQEAVPSDNGIESVLFGAFLPGTERNIAAMTSGRVLVRDHEDFPWGYAPTPQLFGWSAGAADLDADGRDDIVAPDYGRNSLIVLWNESTGL